MRILETQNALLTNYEVYQHIVDTQRRAKNHKRRLPGNLATLLTEIITDLRRPPGPLAMQDETGSYHPDVISQLHERLRAENFQSEIAKGEMLTILNIRPGNAAVLSTVLEDIEERFTEEERARIIAIIDEVLGRDGPADNGEAGQEAIPSIENGN